MTQKAEKEMQRRGFTLVEIMLVVIIIGVLAAMVVPRFAGRTEQAKVARAKSDIAAIGLALDLYEMDMGKYPESETEFKERLINKPSGDEGRNWKGPYLKKGLPNDSWGHPYGYRHPPEKSQDYDLFSLGPDGRPGTDDIGNWE